MSNGIYTALSGAIAQERNLDVVANNVANVNTTGFRADRVSFQQIRCCENPSKRWLIPWVMSPSQRSRLTTALAQCGKRETCSTLPSWAMDSSL